ncbi:Periaxin [Gryllus bimaculatus]|nr:Periaxin [Gryllus bimaculatus]
MLWVVVVVVVTAVAGQEPPVPKDPSDDGPPAPAPEAAGPAECFTAGSVAGAVVGTFAATLLLLAAAALVYKFYWRGRRDGSPLARSPPEKDPNRIDQKEALAGPARVVALRSRDFTGLGFNVCGNMRDGIFVRDVQHRGPAFESGRVQPGDRIEAVRISFRHMVFEDALTILSYASPYEINKASLRRVQQMNVLGNTKNSQSQATDEPATNEYPTLKLSSSPTHPPRENIRLEKTAPTAVVKPERVKRASTPKEPDSSPSGDAGALNKLQKFGVRVLPDPAPRQNATIEAEKHQNEQNLIKERVSTNPFTDSQGHDTVDVEMPSDASLHYDERGIDVGPVEMLNSSSQDQKSQQIERHYQRNVSHDDEEWHKENNVKHLLTKGLQNLKEKLHHDKRSSGSPESPQRMKDKKQKPARQHKTSMSSDSEGLDGERPHEGVMKSKISTREEPEKIERKRQNNPKNEVLSEPMLLPPGSGIPSEIPEEVQRAAAAARNNRKSLQSAAHAPLAPAPETRDKLEAAASTALARENISDSSSDEGGHDASTDSSGRQPKRSNKRKAPLPPAEDAENALLNCTQVASKRGADQDAPTENTTEQDATAQSWNVGKTENVQSKSPGENGTTANSLANLARQRNNLELSRIPIYAR